MTVLALGLTGGATGVALAATKPTKAQKQALTVAKAALARPSDLHGWGSTAAPKKVPQLTCNAFNPYVGSNAPLASAVSRTFHQSSQGPFASQTVYVFSSASQERSYWGRVVTRRLLACVAESLVAGSGNGVRFKVNSKHLQSVPTVGDRDQEYRIRGTANVQEGTDTVYLDSLVVARGRAITALSFTSFFTPASWSIESKLARAVAARMPSS